MKKRVALIALLSVLVLLAVAAALDEDCRKFDLRRIGGRAGWQLPERTVSALALAPGDRVADLGAGRGYFVGFLAREVGSSGRVFAVEVSERALAALADKVQAEGLTNVEVVEGSATDPRLPDLSIDLVFVCDVYHHIGDPVDYFSRLRGDLSERGRVAIIEPRARGFARLVTPGGHATPADELVAAMGRAGYSLAESFDFLPVQNLLVFRPAAASAAEG